MNEELLLSVTPRETRVAIIINGVLREILIERQCSRGLVGNIYRGRVARVLPGMQAAFVDIGLQRTAFLHAADVVPKIDDRESHGVNGGAGSDIKRLVREGDTIVVQVLKDPLGDKGARVTTQLSIASRYLVLLPGSSRTGISQRITQTTERKRLTQEVTKLFAQLDVTAGFIVRTVADSASVESLKTDLLFLVRSWEVIQQRVNSNNVGLLHEDLPLTLRTARDFITEKTTRIRVDNQATVETLRDFARDFLPQTSCPIEYHSGPQTIFDLFGVEEGIQQALATTVELKSGGSLVLEQTESMTTIDVNTGSYVGRRNLEETLFRTNLEAASAIARELRLRNIGGIIIVDFIDMEEEEHRRDLVRALTEAVHRDSAGAQVSDMSDFGLVQIVRKRLRPSLEHAMTEACTACEGSGFQKTPQTVCYEIFRELMRQSLAHRLHAYTVLASPPVIDMLLDEEAGALADLQDLMRGVVHLQVDPLFGRDRYDVVPM